MAAAAKDPAGHLLVVGVNHRSATAALRDRLFAAEPDPRRLLDRIRAAGLSEAMVLSTCERLELVAVDDDPAAAAEVLLGLLARAARTDAAELGGHSFRHQGVEALRHVFAVAASLDSQMIGEPQILGQVKESHRLAAEARLMGPTLESVLQAAYAAAKRVRGETPVAEQPVSIAAAAVQVARDVHGDLSRRRGLLIGLGEMAEFMAAELQDAGLKDLVVVHGSVERAATAAHRLGCHFRPWEELAEALAGADIVVAAVGSGRYSVTAPVAEAALKRRRREAIFLIDAAVPGDVDPAVGRLDGTFVYDLEDLERVALRGKATREAATEAAWRILGEELAGFLRRRAERAAAPAVAALRRHFEAVREQVLAEGRMGAAAATRLLVNRLLHDPSEVLREAAAQPAERNPAARAALAETALRLFRLNDGGQGPETRGTCDAGEEDDG
ncbi:MAG: glutamyl-tRNA reductase [Kiloniellaceae bacterium]